jgi:hypothetical protein
MEVLRKIGDTFYIRGAYREVLFGGFSLKGIDVDLDSKLDKGYLPVTTQMGLSTDGNGVLFVSYFIDKEKSELRSPDVLEVLMYHSAGERIPYKSRKEIPVFVHLGQYLTIGGEDFKMYSNARTYDIDISDERIKKAVMDYEEIFNDLPIVLYFESPEEGKEEV